MTKERPILFRGEMIRQLLAGRKTMTRRVVKPQPDGVMGCPNSPSGWSTAYDKETFEGTSPRCHCKPLLCPYGTVGDHLWIRETFVIESNADIESAAAYPPPFTDGRPTNWHEDDGALVWQQCHYRATDPTPALHYDDTDEPACRWRPSIFMPRWASRITLEVTDVRCERLGDMTEADAEAEGVQASHLEWWQGFMRNADGSRHMAEGGSGDTPPAGMEAAEKQTYSTTAREQYRVLWNEINRKTHPWTDNPWVWCLAFTRVADRRDATTNGGQG